MMGHKLQRRTFLVLGASTLITRQSLLAAPDANVLDTFIARYMKAMNAPGMTLTLALAKREGIARIATFGFSDRESQEAVTPDHLFQVGSRWNGWVRIVSWPMNIPGSASRWCSAATTKNIGGVAARI